LIHNIINYGFVGVHGSTESPHWTVNCPGFNECAEENQEQDVVVHWFNGSLFNGGCLTAERINVLLSGESTI